MTIILDIGSGRSMPTPKAAHDLIERIRAIVGTDQKHEWWLKPQMFEHAPPNEPLATTTSWLC